MRHKAVGLFGIASHRLVSCVAHHSQHSLAQRLYLVWWKLELAIAQADRHLLPHILQHIRANGLCAVGRHDEGAGALFGFDGVAGASARTTDDTTRLEPCSFLSALCGRHARIAGNGRRCTARRRRTWRGGRLCALGYSCCGLLVARLRLGIRCAQFVRSARTQAQHAFDGMNHAPIGKFLHGLVPQVFWLEAVHGTPFESRSFDSFGVPHRRQTIPGGQLQSVVSRSEPLNCPDPRTWFHSCVTMLPNISTSSWPDALLSLAFCRS